VGPKIKKLPMDYVTKNDLKEQTKAIKEHINLLIAPIVKTQDDMEIILIGESKINGVVGRLKSTIINLRIIYIFLTATIGLLVKLLFFKSV